MVNGRPMTLTQPQNGDTATLAGVELAFQRRLRMLPAPLNAVSVYSDYSWMTSEARYPRPAGSLAPMLGQTPHQGNVGLSYERGRFSGRVAMSFNGQYLTTIGRKEEDDQRLAGRTQTDLSIAHQVARRTWIVFDVRNLTNGPSKTLGSDPDRPMAIEQFGSYTTLEFAWRSDDLVIVCGAWMRSPRDRDHPALVAAGGQPHVLRWHVPDVASRDDVASHRCGRSNRGRARFRDT
jgi:hypothetical protein